MFEDDWGAVSEHVGTRTKEQCVAQFLQLPVEDEYTNPPSQGDLGPLQYARIPFDKSDNPVMSVVAFLAGAVGPGVAAAAAQAGMVELTDNLKRKAAKKAEERRKAESNESPTNEKHESVEPQSFTVNEAMDPAAVPPKPSSSGQPRSTVERAAALALSSASVKAQALASHEEEHIRALTSKIVAAQRTKLELKLEQFEAMEQLVEEERQGLEEARLALFREKNSLTTQLLELKNLVLQQRQMGGGIPPGFETQFNMLAQSDVPHAHEVPMHAAEYVQGASIAHLH
jgi:SWI/SNF related-matrix-associated actin-dependent regulator of chromatin subfamily C